MRWDFNSILRKKLNWLKLRPFVVFSKMLETFQALVFVVFYLREQHQNQQHNWSCDGKTNAEQMAVHKRQPRTFPSSQTGHGEQLLLQITTALPTVQPFLLQSIILHNKSVTSAHNEYCFCFAFSVFSSINLIWNMLHFVLIVKLLRCLNYLFFPHLIVCFVADSPREYRVPMKWAETHSNAELIFISYYCV